MAGIELIEKGFILKRKIDGIKYKVLNSYFDTQIEQWIYDFKGFRIIGKKNLLKHFINKNTNILTFTEEDYG